LNTERTEALANTDDDGILARLNNDELFRLRDIAGEAMQLVDELKQSNPSEVTTDAYLYEDQQPIKIPEQQVWVAELRAGDGTGWMGLYRTPEGANKALETQAAAWGLDLATIDAGDNTDGSTYMLAVLPVMRR
jgi:hypothetical protein